MAPADDRPTISALLEDRAKLEAAYRSLYAGLIKANRFVMSPATSQADRVDAVFLVRRLEELADDLRKEAKKVREMGERIACLRWTVESEADDETPRSIKGRYVTATPNMRMSANLPSHKSNPEAYAAFMRSVGIDPDSAVVQTGAVQMHFPGLERMLTQLAAEAKPLPTLPADSLIPVYTLTMRSREA